MKYELTFLLNEEAELKTIKDLVESFKGKILKEDKWGKKTLAYPIKKQMSLLYFQWIIELPPSQALALKRKLNFNEKLIRYLMLKSE